MKKRVSPQLKVRTSLSLSKTKPSRPSRFANLKRKLTTRTKPPVTKAEPKSPEKSETSSNLRQRVQPESKIAQEQKLSLWFIPARLAFFFSGIYYLAFSVMGFLGVLSNYKIIKPFFTLPYESTFSSFFLLEIAAMFALIASLMYFHAARNPRDYRWFYFFLIIIFIPYHFLTNLQKMQIELPQDFQNYLTFDTIVLGIFWGAFLLSLYPYLKIITRKP